MNMPNKPTNPQLWERAKTQAKQKFDVYPSAYANLWASKWYKERGGDWAVDSVKKSATIQKDLREWLREKWVDISKPKRNENGEIVGYEKCGSGDKGGYPKCLPEKKASRLNDNQRNTLVQRKRKVGMPQNGAPTMTSSKLNKYFK
jgi:hypothetical protein